MTHESPFLIESSVSLQGPVLTIRNAVNGEFFTVLPESGGRIAELWLSNGSESLSVLRTITDVASVKRDDLFTNAKLSPFAGRIRGGKYTALDSSFTLPLNYPEEQNACHGFVYDKRFDISDVGLLAESASCTLKHRYDGDVPGYPFAFTIWLTYALSREGGIVCTTRVTNESTRPMPLSDGWHYYFDLGCPIDEIELSLSVAEQMDLDEHRIPTGVRRTFDAFRNPRHLGSQHFDTCFRVSADGESAVTRLILKKRDITLQIWQHTRGGQYQYLVIYTPPDRRSIAIEPMTGNVNAFNNGEGLIMLSPGATFIANCGIVLERTFHD